MTPYRFALRIVCAAMLLVLSGPIALAQNYPVRPLRLIVPQPPGGGNDTIARMISQRVAVTLQQQVVIDNRAGAGGLIAAELAARAAPDGYTLFLGNAATLSVIPHLQAKPPYDALRDFAPISLIASAPLLVVLHPSVPATSVRELIALAKARPGQLNYASNGVGSTTHLATELFNSMAGTKLTHVPYKGLAAASTDLLAGQVQLMFSSAVAMLPHVKTGRLRAIAMTGVKRAAVLPDLPTVAEAGVPDYQAGSWYGILAPAKTSPAIIDVLGKAIVAATRSPDIIERMSFEAVIPIGSTPAEFAAHIRNEYTRIGNLIRTSGARFEP
ncbi:MAG: Tricarboxylate transport protein TctC [Betaproteobacteria bacterium]|nr:Tricarboxylate transport protein TctC [Betaproteobacteria bacterium]